MDAMFRTANEQREDSGELPSYHSGVLHCVIGCLFVSMFDDVDETHHSAHTESTDASTYSGQFGV